MLSNLLAVKEQGKYLVFNWKKKSGMKNLPAACGFISNLNRLNQFLSSSFPIFVLETR